MTNDSTAQPDVSPHRPILGQLGLAGASVRRLLSMIRFSHTLFALPVALLSAILAWHGPAKFRWVDLAGVIVCMVGARSAAMAFNRLVDVRWDALNPRTSRRHLPTGELSPAGVAWFTLASGLFFVAGTLLFLPNTWPLVLALPVLAFLLGYSYAKRFTTLVHFWLGAALALSPLAAWLAVSGSLGWTPVVLGLAVLLWVAGFDMIYACQDVEVDRRDGLFSLPARLGVAGALRVAAVCHGGMIIMLLLLAWMVPSLGGLYLAGVAAVAVLLAYEHWLIRPDDLARVNQAFFHVNAVISVGLLIVTTMDCWLG